MSCGVESVRTTDEDGNMNEQPTTDVTGNALVNVLDDPASEFYDSIPETLFDNETFDESLTEGFTTRVENPGAPRDAIGDLIKETVYGDGGPGGEYNEVVDERETETVTITDPDSGASIDVERITKIVFIQGVDETKRLVLNLGPWE